jgi:hypothetical protein
MKKRRFSRFVLIALVVTAFGLAIATRSFAAIYVKTPPLEMDPIQLEDQLPYGETVDKVV